MVSAHTKDHGMITNNTCIRSLPKAAIAAIALATVFALRMLPSDSDEQPIGLAAEAAIAHWSISDPAGFNAEMDLHKTDQDRAEEALYRWAFENPAAYHEEYVLPFADRDPEAAAVASLAVLSPSEAIAEKAQRMTPEEKLVDDLLQEAIERVRP
jgi:hypothetical protein